MSRLERLFLIDAAIRSGLYPSVYHLAKEHSIGPRTIKADIRYLKQRVHAPIRHNRRRGGYEYTDTSFVLPRLILTEREVNAVRRAMQAAREFGGVSGDAEVLELLAQRIGGVPPLQGGGPTVAGGTRLATSSLVPPELLPEIESAITRRRRVVLSYHGAHRGTATERTIQPWHLYLIKGEWYVTGYCELRQAQRDFHLSRVRAWRVEPEEGSFRRPADFDGEAYVKAALVARHGEPPVTVKIRFSAYQAKWIVERVYHSTQTLEPQPDGSLIFSMTVTGIWEARRWVLGFGAEAEVLEPEELRAELAAEVRKLQEIYGSGAEGSLVAPGPHKMMME